jgi:hypothetical protein
MGAKLTDLYVLSLSLEYENGFCYAVSLSMYVCASIVERILSILRIQEFIRHRSALGEYEHSSSKNRRP